MVLPGSLIPDSNKRQREQSAPARPPPGSASERLARLLQREAEASHRRIAGLEERPNRDNPANAPTRNDRDSPDEHEQQQDIYNHLQLTDEVNNITPVNDATEIHPPGLRSAYFKSVTYQERTLIKEANWKKIVPDLFVSFMSMCMPELEEECSRGRCD
ncbi:uncharacterized protein MELLADRAFT_107905 [Melampsora larici-populina 98AG31]|uniref:Uncharacterized protein n=1 Tax=Melampsora larici-populina (strain 98AG31 / pathotype 3-4-7) TaxID=747676 RepID=F4RRC3_MELLP|nr:uncharacterized protein MELLADRAFT_107905 [Melampsora larici-populina 98AG31]EGG05057.1 hypothetical protein MELLADRAFT_107905 [Melampsora larici-populina 98AG31]